MRFGRRHFATTLAWAAMIALPLPTWFGMGRKGAPRNNAARLVRLSAGSASARALGKAYLANVTDEASVLGLVRSIESRIAPYAPVEPTDQELATAIARLRTADFEEGDVVTVDGWVLSRSEAQLCALATLVDQA